MPVMLKTVKKTLVSGLRLLNPHAPELIKDYLYF